MNSSLNAVSSLVPGSTTGEGTGFGSGGAIFQHDVLVFDTYQVGQSGFKDNYIGDGVTTSDCDVWSTKIRGNLNAFELAFLSGTVENGRLTSLAVHWANRDVEAGKKKDQSF